MLELLVIALVVLATGAAYVEVRDFVTERLRYVPAVRRPIAPLVAGAAAALLAAPIVWLLPFVGVGTAILIGGGVAAGVVAGAKEIRRRDLPGW